MFVGHVGAALGLHRLERRLHPGALVAAALLLDLILWVLVAAGVEQMLVPADFAHHHYLMFVFPYSHSLLATILWSLLAGAITFAAVRPWGLSAWRAGALVAGAVASHYLLDLLLHVRGLPLAGDGSPRIGLGLWEHVPAAIAVEATVTVAGAWSFLRGAPISRSRAVALIVVLLLLMAMTIAGETAGEAPANVRALAVVSWISDVAVILLCGWLAAARRTA